MASTFESKNMVLTQKLDNTVYEMMPKTNSDMVYVDDETTLTERLYEISELFTEYGGKQDELKDAYLAIMDGADENYNSFKEIWDYININGEPKSELIKLIESKQNSEEGKGLSTHDLTDVLYEKIVNDYTKEELDEKFTIIFDDNDGFVATVNKKIADIENDISEINEEIESVKESRDNFKTDVSEGKAAPNIIDTENEDSVQNIHDYSCWYKVISKDNE